MRAEGRPAGLVLSRGPSLETQRETGRGWPTSLHRSTLPNTTCNPSKKLSPMIMTVAPPVVQPSPGLMALMQGVAAGR